MDVTRPNLFDFVYLEMSRNRINALYKMKMNISPSIVLTHRVRCEVERRQSRYHVSTARYRMPGLGQNTDG